MRRNFPRPYTTTYLRVVVVAKLVVLADSELTAILQVVLTGFEYRLFPLRPCRGLFRCRFGLTRPVLALQSDLPPHAPSILSLLTGIASARPSAFVDGAGLEPASRVQQLTLLAYTRLLALPSELPALVSTFTWYFILGFS